VCVLFYTSFLLVYCNSHDPFISLLFPFFWCLSIVSARLKPIAPTCNICLVRTDHTTLWCEVTSSIRSKNVDEDEDELMEETNTNSEFGKNGRDNKEGGGVEVLGRGFKKPSTNSLSQRASSPTLSCQDDKESTTSSMENKATVPAIQVQEILLCLRPIRDGSLAKANKVTADYRHRFKTATKKNSKRIQVAAENSASSEGKRAVSDDTNTAPSSHGTRNDGNTSSVMFSPPKALETSIKLLKKRPVRNDETEKHHSSTMISGEQRQKKGKIHHHQHSQLFEASSLDASVVVESLMLMNKQQHPK
jgi:hypothetical protein